MLRGIDELVHTNRARHVFRFSIEPGKHHDRVAAIFVQLAEAAVAEAAILQVFAAFQFQCAEVREFQFLRADAACTKRR
jgi:hypothetical protein